MMKKFAYTLTALLPVAAFAAVRFAAPQMPASPYDDTEISTNFVFLANFDKARAFELSLDFEAAATNTLQLAFGADADSDGELDWDETDFVLGWRCGEWFCRDMDLDAGHSAAASAGQKHFAWRLALKPDMTPESLSAFDGETAVQFTASSGMFRPGWNLCRVTARGMGGQMYLATGSLVAPGFTMRFK